MFEGEGHGFRRAETIKAATEAQIYFLGRIFGFEPADPTIPIENLDRDGSHHVLAETYVYVYVASWRSAQVATCAERLQPT
jgi:hypothetical protein